MSQSTAPSDTQLERELLEMIQGDSEAVLRDNTDLLREMRDETDHDVLAEYIDALLDRFEGGEQS